MMVETQEVEALRLINQRVQRESPTLTITTESHRRFAPEVRRPMWSPFPRVLTQMDEDGPRPWLVGRSHR